jgi:hypothetical protein
VEDGALGGGDGIDKKWKRMYKMGTSQSSLTGCENFLEFPQKKACNYSNLLKKLKQLE